MQSIFVDSVIQFLNMCETNFSRPKLLTESGNFVIESAKDRNVSIRLKGSSYLNINGMDVMSFSGLPNQSNLPILRLRLSTLEYQIRQFQFGGSSSSSPSSAPSHSHNIWQRLISLEHRVINGSGALSNSTLLRFHRRVFRLESDINQLLSRLSADNCSSNPCLNGGTCFNTFGGYVCRCPAAWTGSSCEQDVNECLIFANTDLGCQNSIACENTLGGYTLVIHCTVKYISQRKHIDLTISLCLFFFCSFCFVGVDVSPVGWEYTVQSERLTVQNHRHMSCAATVFVYTHKIRKHTNAFVIKVGRIMEHHRRVRLM